LFNGKHPHFIIRLTNIKVYSLYIIPIYLSNKQGLLNSGFPVECPFRQPRLFKPTFSVDTRQGWSTPPYSCWCRKSTL